MAGGPVNRNELESFYQNPGDIYDDAMTEGAFGVVADQIDANWFDYKAVKDQLQSTTPGASGSELVKSPTINGLNGNTVYAQIVALVAQIQEILNANIPDASITYPKLAADVIAAFVNTTGDTMTGPLTVRPAGELSSVIGSIADLLTGIKDTGTNNSYLLQRFIRARAGTDWTTVDLEIGRQTDSTIQQRVVMTGDGLMVFTAAADIRAKIDAMGSENAVSLMTKFAKPGGSMVLQSWAAEQSTTTSMNIPYFTKYPGRYRMIGEARSQNGGAGEEVVVSFRGQQFSTSSTAYVPFTLDYTAANTSIDPAFYQNQWSFKKNGVGQGYVRNVSITYDISYQYPMA